MKFELNDNIIIMYCARVIAGCVITICGGVNEVTGLPHTNRLPQSYDIVGNSSLLLRY